MPPFLTSDLSAEDGLTVTHHLIVNHIWLLATSLSLLFLFAVAMCAEECEEEENSEDRTLRSAGTSPAGGVSPRRSTNNNNNGHSQLTPLPKQSAQQGRTPVSGAAATPSSNLGTSPKLASSGAKNSAVKGGGGRSSLPSKQRTSKLFGNRSANASSAASSDDSSKSDGDKKMVSMLFNVLSKNKVKGISLYKGGKQKQQQPNEGAAGGCRKF